MWADEINDPEYQDPVYDDRGSTSSASTMVGPTGSISVIVLVILSSSDIDYILIPIYFSYIFTFIFFTVSKIKYMDLVTRNN
jgi:hypothetical protein